MKGLSKLVVPTTTPAGSRVAMSKRLTRRDMTTPAQVSIARQWQSCPLRMPRRPLVIGALGTSLTWGADLADRIGESWPTRLEQKLRTRLQRDDLFVVNGAQRATSADFAALCFDELWGAQWSDVRGVAHPPRLDLCIIEFNWSSSAGQMAALIEELQLRGIPVVAVLYYHPVNVMKLSGRKHEQSAPFDDTNFAFGKHSNFAYVFNERGVPFVNTSLLNAKYGWRAMLNTTQKIRSAAHLSPLGHEGIASLLSNLLLDSASDCAKAFRLPSSTASASSSSDAAGSSRYFCRIGSSLSDITLQRATTGFRMLQPTDGRTPGLVANDRNASLAFVVPTPIPNAGRYLSVAIERSYRHTGSARITCHGVCICAPVTFDMHSKKKYTYLQRTTPRWLYTPSAALLATAASSPQCRVLIEALNLTEGRLMVKAITISAPRPGPGNRSVSVNSLYALP